MGSTRAVFASIGVSVSLVAAAALSLFAVSVVIAFGGWSAGMGDSGPATTLVFGASDPMPAKAVRNAKTELAPVVLRAARPAPRPAAAASQRAHAVAQSGSDAHARVISHAVISNVPPKPLVQQPAAPVAASHMPATGDGVRRVGEDLSSTAHSTGEALADVTAPLGPPVSAAVQKVLDLVAALLRRTTNGLGGTLDAVGSK